MSERLSRICRHIMRPDQLPLEDLSEDEQHSLGLFIGSLEGFAIALIILQPVFHQLLS